MKKFAFWRNLYLYFYFFALLGHFLELGWAGLARLIGMPPFVPKMTSWTPVAPPYGIGVALVILLGFPLIHWLERRLRGGKNPRPTGKKSWLITLGLIVLAFLIAGLIFGATEGVAGWIIITAMGYNKFWDYSGRAGALLGGTVWLPNILIFGALGALLILWVLPRTNRLLGKIPARVLNIVFWVLFITFVLDVLTKNVFLPLLVG